MIITRSAQSMPFLHKSHSAPRLRLGSTIETGEIDNSASALNDSDVRSSSFLHSAACHWAVSYEVLNFVTITKQFTLEIYSGR